jgi:hypothetical protein
MLNISSMLPETIIEGTADTKPETNLPIIAPGRVGEHPMTIQEIQYTNDADI